MGKKNYQEPYYDSSNDLRSGQSYSVKSKPQQRQPRLRNLQTNSQKSNQQIIPSTDVQYQSTIQKKKVGRKTQVWTRQRQKLFLMFFPDSLIKDPLKSYQLKHWKQNGTFSEIQKFINQHERLHSNSMAKIKSDQIKSYAQRMKKKWEAKGQQKTLLVLVMQELFEEFVLKDKDRKVIELMNKFQHDGTMERISQLQKELREI